MFSAQPDKHGSNFNDPSAVVSSPFEEKKQPTSCRDPLFAVLFYANLAAIIGVAAAFGANPFSQNNDNQQENNNNNNGEESIDITPFINIAGACGAVALVLTCLALQILMMIPGFLIKAALFGNIIISLAMVVAAIYFNQMGVAIIGGIFFLLTCCYTYCIWSRIPFATANLKTGCTAIRANCGVSFLSYIVVVFEFAWSLLWVVAVLGIQDRLLTCQEINGEQVCSDPNYLLFFLLFVSFYFTHQVLKNTVHTTIAGVVGSWWFVPDESGFCGKAVCGSFFRSITTSFGSICFGSLIVAIIQALRQIVQMAKDNDDIGPFIACCIDCILSCIEGLVEYFNKWAFVYVGLYGYSYCEAGKNVMSLFRDRGWEAVIADDIVGAVLGFLSLISGLITLGIGVFIASTVDWFDAMINAGTLTQDVVLIFAGV